VAGNGDLIRSMRAGGGGGMAAAQELLRRAQAGSVTPAELHEVQKVIALPELRDAFKDIAGELGAFTRGRGEAVFRDVDALLPDTDKLTDARELPERFLADLTLVQGELLNHPGMTRSQKAQRLYSFFEAYAARFTQLAQGTAQAKQAQVTQPTPTAQALYGATEMAHTLAAPLTDVELQKVLGRFDKALTRAGFNELRADDGRTGLELARQLLQAKTAEAQREARPQRLDAPGWKDNAAPERALNVDARRAAPVDVKPQILPHTKAPGVRVDAPPKKDEPAPRGPRRSDKVLGGHMLWNALHLLRGEELDDVAKKDAMTQLAIAAGLLLGLISILVGLLVLL
jgi:hypothetical protein